MSDTIETPDDRLAKWLRQLHAPDENIRARAAMRLTGPGIDPRSAIPILQESLLDPDPSVRRLAAWCLNRMGGERSAA